MDPVNPFGFYALRNAWLFALAAPLVLFYFLKLKRPRASISSLALWQRVLQDKRVNSPFQRFKRNILLFLQLLLLVLLASAAMQPYFRGSEAQIDRMPILIDCSASMAAVDAAGRSRLDLAQTRVERLIQNLLPNQELCLVTFAQSARRHTGFTNNKRLLRSALADIRVDDVPSDIEEALQIVQALALTNSFGRVLLLSDGNFPNWTGLELSFELDYQRLPAAGPNLGVISLNARRIDTETWDVFAKIAGSGDSESGARVELRQDGEPLSTERVLISGGEEEERLVFRVTGSQRSALEVRLVPDGVDSLPQDNVACLSLPPARDLRVYVSDGLESYRHALQGLDGVGLTDAPGTSRPESGCDLVISETHTEAYAATPTQLYIGVLPSDLAGMIEISQEGTEVVDWQRTCALLQYVQMRDVVILDRPVSRPGIDESHLENAGYEVLAHGREGPLILRQRTGTTLAFFLLFHTDRSTLPYRIGFPIMVANVAQLALRRAGLAEAEPVCTGVLPPITVSPSAASRIRLPDGTVLEQDADAEGILSGVRARQVGYYDVSDTEGKSVKIGASLLNAGETCLAAVEEIQFQEALSVAASSQLLKTDKPLWATLGLLAFAVMLGEWWYYQRRSGG